MCGLGTAVYRKVSQVQILSSAPHGAIAQLVERLNGIQEVRGSIPLGSTKKNSGYSAIFILFLYVG